MPSVAIIDSDPEFCRRQQSAINKYGFFKCSSFFTSCKEAIRQLPKEKPDVILMDIEFPGTHDTPGTCTVKILSGKIPGVRIIVLTDNRDTECLMALINTGVTGFVARDIAPGMLNAIIKTASPEVFPVCKSMITKLLGRKQKDKNTGLYHLSPQMITILHLLNEGFTYEQIARNQGVSINSVKKQIERMYEILDAHSKIQASRKGKELGYI